MAPTTGINVPKLVGIEKKPLREGAIRYGNYHDRH